MTWTTLFIFFAILIIAIFAISFSNFQQLKQDRNDGYIYSQYNIKYCGGFPEISSGKNILTNIKLNNENLSVEFTRENILKNISINKITDAMCTTTEEVNKMASLGKLIIFGYLALGMSSTKDIKKCAVITYEDDFGKERSLVFEMYPDILVRNILNIKRK
jgi:hypothetical protein